MLSGDEIFLLRFLGRVSSSEDFAVETKPSTCSDHDVQVSSSWQMSCWQKLNEVTSSTQRSETGPPAITSQRPALAAADDDMMSAEAYMGELRKLQRQKNEVEARFERKVEQLWQRVRHEGRFGEKRPPAGLAGLMVSDGLPSWVKMACGRLRDMLWFPWRLWFGQTHEEFRAMCEALEAYSAAREVEEAVKQELLQTLEEKLVRTRTQMQVPSGKWLLEPKHGRSFFES